ncbi:hypothetical protein ACKGJY_00345 [Hyunsoonleella sp. 2307UL5-6]|uniref:hypothetical protein n=1 Tax=Hyunsoonleella sp. 2307UL5-6 TaxID=3384768 RepID=UPI0039BC5538
MKYSLLLVCIGCIWFFSCDGRLTKQESLKKSVKAFNNAEQHLNSTNIFPEHYAEVENDTILSNGYRVKLKNFTNMNALLDAPKLTTTKILHKFRRVDSEITVYKDDKLIYKDVIKSMVLEDYYHNKMDIKHYLNNGISVDELASLETGKLILITSNTVLGSDKKTYYKISIDAHGNSNFKTIDDART